jgi:hypothetical protein
MKGQQSGWLWVRNYNDSQSFATTVQVHNRTVLAEVAAVHINVADDERHRSIIYISQVVSDRGSRTSRIPTSTRSTVPVSRASRLKCMCFRAILPVDG